MGAKRNSIMFFFLLCGLHLFFFKLEQALCFFAGANSIFTGDKLLTTPNPEFNTDAEMFGLLGLEGKSPNLEFPSTVGLEEEVSSVNTTVGLAAASPPPEPPQQQQRMMARE